MEPDPFVHLPRLRDKLTPPDKSEYRATPEVLASWDKRARGLGLPANWRRSDERLEASRRAVLANRNAGEDLWVYAYGSLMWDPSVYFAEVRLADAEGYQRRFTSRITIGRGSPDRPALMLSLHRGPGTCKGLAFRIAAELVENESAIVWRREMLLGGYSPLMAPMSTPQGAITALTFAANPSRPGYIEELPLSETANLIARGAGIMGTNRDYLEQLADQLEALEIEDQYVQQLRERVRGIGNA